MIKRKTCTEKNCTNFIWKQGFCQRHLPFSNKILTNTTRLNKISAQGIIKKLEKTVNTKKLHPFMKEWWDNLPPKERYKCWSCGGSIGPEFSTGYVDHLLEKSTYPELAYKEDNFFNTCLNCHTAKSNGYPSENHLKAINKAKEKLLT